MKVLKHFIVGMAIFLLAGVSSSYAATLEFSPSSANIDSGEVFETDVVVDLGEEEGQGIDAYITYDPDVLEAIEIVRGDILNITTDEIKEPGLIYIAGVTEQPGESITGEGVYATIRFKGKTAGTTDIEFTCEQGETNESNIVENSTDALDIIQCSLNGEAVVIVDGGGTGGSPDEGTSGDTPDTLPETGIFDNIIILSALGGILLMIGIGARALVASRL